ncbi:MAG: maltose alpha-D-glucosyltransferase [PVC group bacterium]
MNTPKGLLPAALLIFTIFFGPTTSEGAAGGSDSYIQWLEDRAMLREAGELAGMVSGRGNQWRHPYALPQPEKLIETASVWFTAYPSSTITGEGESVLQAMGNENLWVAFEEIGIQAMHTGPVRRAGGIQGRGYTPTVDGWFDRISYHVDPIFGDDEHYKALVAMAHKHGAIIIGDIIPGHTGKGADFRLAERGYKDYPGLYSMVTIEKDDWGLLPDVSEGEDSVNLPADTVERLKDKGYIPGQLQRVLYSVPGGGPVTAWNATPVVTGTDGKERRWVYLHYFRPGQPTLNWLDPSFAANRLIAGDIVKTRLDLGARVIRLDANPFLGLEIKPGSAKCWSEGHPLSVTSSEYIAWLMRKLGGWSFQELNLTIEDIKEFSELGPDLSYDFITRPAYAHALLTGNAGFLRLTLSLMFSSGVKPLKLIHALQNHDEITYELVQFSEQGNDLFDYGGKKVRGEELRREIIDEMHRLATGPDYPYNKLSGNGLCTTCAGLCAAALGVKDPRNITDEEKDKLKKGHLLMAMYNAMQPGVFALSGWDLVGALPVPTGEITSLLADGDYRWVNRGAYDLMDVNPAAKKSSAGMPKAQALYGPLPQQLKDPSSFASRLKKMLKIRKEYKLDLAERIGLPEVKNPGSVLMVNRLPDGLGIELTALNFGRESVEETFTLGALQGLTAQNLITGEAEGAASPVGAFTVKLDALSGKAILFPTD